MAHGRFREIRLWAESLGFLMLLILLVPVGVIVKPAWEIWDDFRGRSRGRAVPVNKEASHGQAEAALVSEAGGRPGGGPGVSLTPRGS